MLYNILYFLGGVIFAVIVFWLRSKQIEKDNINLSRVAFETKNNVIKALVYKGSGGHSLYTYWSDIASLSLNPRNWWCEGEKNKRGKFEESLTHLYSIQNLKNSFAKIIEENHPAQKPIKKQGGLN